MKILLLILYGLLLTTPIVKSQNVISIGNYIGFNCETENSLFESTVDDIISKFPDSLQANFKVIKYNYYLYDYKFENGGFLNFDELLDSVHTISQYYLFIAKQLNEFGECIKFNITINLPTTDAFSCLDSLSKVNLQNTLTHFISNYVSTQHYNDCSIINAENELLKLFRKSLDDIIFYDCQIPGTNTILEWLASEGFIEIELNCKILGDLDGFRQNNYKVSRSTNFVTDYAELAVEINGIVKNISDEINEFIEYNNLDDSNPKFYIISYNNIFNGDYQEAKTNIIQDLPYLGGIIYLNKNTIGKDQLFLRIEGYKAKDVLNATSYDETYTPPSPSGCTSFQDLITTISSAETILENNGYQNVEEKIKILRGIYYGTNWSMDYNQNYGTSVRNAGFKIFLCNNSDPINPQSIFGPTLFNKLKRSPEVVNGSQGVDWGHIIIGLEARMSSCSREILFPGYWSTGLEMVTWIGDLGGGSGMLSYKRCQNPTKRAIDMFSNTSDFGGWINLEGDIAAYIIGRDPQNLDQNPYLMIESNESISEIIAKYLLPQPTTNASEWQNRSKTFLKMLGGNLDKNNKLSNENQVSKYIEAKVSYFSENYLIQLGYSRNKDNDPNNDINMYNSSKYIQGVSKEMTDIFVKTLIKSIDHPELHISSSGFNPEPSSPGDPYIRYKLWEKTKSIVTEIGDWFKN